MAGVTCGLKTLSDAVDLRDRIFGAFEEAERTDDPADREEWLTFVVVGGGPTGVEISGQLAILSRHTMKRDFRRIDPRAARVILLDAGERVISAFSEPSSAKTAKELGELCVTVREHAMVTDIDAHGVTVRTRDKTERIATRTVVWAAGVRTAGIAEVLARARGRDELVDVLARRRWRVRSSARNGGPGRVLPGSTFLGLWLYARPGAGARGGAERDGHTLATCPRSGCACAIPTASRSERARTNRRSWPDRRARQDDRPLTWHITCRRMTPPPADPHRTAGRVGLFATPPSASGPTRPCDSGRTPGRRPSSVVGRRRRLRPGRLSTTSEDLRLAASRSEDAFSAPGRRRHLQIPAAAGANLPEPAAVLGDRHAQSQGKATTRQIVPAMA